jgi:hypothetical protein
MNMNTDLFLNMKTMPSVVIIIGMIVVFLSKSASFLMLGYGSMLAGLLVLLVWVFRFIGNTSMQNKVTTMLPFIFSIGIILTMMVYLSVYFKNISQGKVSHYYYSFSNTFTLFFLVQVGFLVSVFASKSFETTQSIGSSNTSFLMLMSAVNFILTITLGIILAFYKTDG